MMVCYRHSGKNQYIQNNSIKFETESIKASPCHYSDPFVLVTGDVRVNADKNTDVAFKNHFLHARQKLMMCLLMKQIIFTLQCLCKVWSNIVILILMHKEVDGRLKQMEFEIIMLIWLLITLIYLNMKQLL